MFILPSSYNASKNRLAQWLLDVMAVPMMQSISGNSDGTYTSYTSPSMAHVLGLARRPC
jgi:hypothetical protein